MRFNQEIWRAISELGWWWWGTWVVVSAYNIWLLGRMGKATTSAGRMARVLAWVGHLGMLFSPFLNALGTIALPLLLLSNAFHYKQLADACARERASANPKYRARKILSTLVVPK